MSTYNEVKEKIKSTAGSRTFSAASFEDLTKAALNDKTAGIKIYDDDNPNGREINIAEEFQTGVKKLVSRTYGIKEPELDKDLEVNKEIASAVSTWARIAPSEYTSCGKNLRLLTTEKNTFAAQILNAAVEEKVEDTNKIVEVEPGKWESQATGKRLTTKAHNELKVKKIPLEWLVERKDI